MLSSSSSLFTSLPARPPTPPRDVQEHVQNALDFLENGHEEAEQDASESSKRQLSTDTPPVSSPASSSVEAPAGSNATKKVGFSPFPPTFHEIPKTGVSSSPRDRLLRSTPRPDHETNQIDIEIVQFCASTHSRRTGAATWLLLTRGSCQFRKDAAISTKGACFLVKVFTTGRLFGAAGRTHSLRWHP